MPGGRTGHLQRSGETASPLHGPGGPVSTWHGLGEAVSTFGFLRLRGLSGPHGDCARGSASTSLDLALSGLRALGVGYFLGLDHSGSTSSTRSRLAWPSGSASMKLNQNDPISRSSQLLKPSDSNAVFAHICKALSNQREIINFDAQSPRTSSSTSSM